MPVLSVRESLVPVFAMRDPPGEGNPSPYSRSGFPLDRLNPGIATYLRSCLQDQVELASPPRTQFDALFCLGLVCTPEDIEWVDSYVGAFLTGFHDRGGDPQYSISFAGAIGGFGGMALMRHPEAARRFVEKYSRVASWAPYGTSAKTLKPISWEQQVCGLFALHAYAYSKSEMLHDLLRKQYDAPEEETLGIHRKLVEHSEKVEAGYLIYTRPRKPPLSEQDALVRRCVEEFGSQIDALIQRVDDPTKALAHPPGVAPPDVAPAQQAAARPSSPAVPTSGPVVGYAQATIQEALAAYSAIAAAWREGEMAKLRGCLLDGGKPLKDTEFDGLLQAPEEVERERRLLLALAKSGPVIFCDFDVTFSTEASWRIPSLPEPGSAAPAKALAREEVILTFTIQGSAPILRENWPAPAAFTERTQTPEDDLRVYMRKIGGTWYWNPFGW